MVVVICLFFLPESPEFLEGQKKWDELRVAVNYIAKFNRAKTAFNGVFEGEV